LFIKRKDNHPMPVVGITQSREYLPAHAKISMSHMSAFGGLGQAESNPAKFVWLHRVRRNLPERIRALERNF
jgi:hypothetical protein